MKVTVTEKEKEKDIEFPCLMIKGDIVIIATYIDGKKMFGTSLKTGKYSENWSAELFKPFNGTITLQND